MSKSRPKLFDNADVDPKTLVAATELGFDYLHAAAELFENPGFTDDKDWPAKMLGRVMFSLSVEIIQLRAKVAKLTAKQARSPVKRKRSKKC